MSLLRFNEKKGFKISWYKWFNTAFWIYIIVFVIVIVVCIGIGILKLYGLLFN